MVGAYFLGSVALGGYVPGESDVDIAALTERAVPDQLKSRIADRLLDPAGMGAGGGTHNAGIWAMRGFRNVILSGAGFGGVIASIGVLAAFSAVFIAIAANRFNYNGNKTSFA